MKTLNDIFWIVCDYYGMQTIDVKSKSRKGELVKVKRMFCYIVKKHYMYGVNLNMVGAVFNCDHCTVLHHYKKQEGFIEMYPTERNEMMEIINKINTELSADGTYSIENKFTRSLQYLTNAMVIQEKLLTA